MVENHEGACERTECPASVLEIATGRSTFNTDLPAEANRLINTHEFYNYPHLYPESEGEPYGPHCQPLADEILGRYGIETADDVEDSSGLYRGQTFRLRE